MPVVINRAETSNIGGAASKSNAKSAKAASGESNNKLVMAVSAGVVLVAVLIFFVVQLVGGGGGSAANPGVTAGPGAADREEMGQTQSAATPDALPGSASQPAQRNDDD